MITAFFLIDREPRLTRRLDTRSLHELIRHNGTVGSLATGKHRVSHHLNDASPFSFNSELATVAVVFVI